jgi:hypothetical protein
MGRGTPSPRRRASARHMAATAMSCTAEPTDLYTRMWSLLVRPGCRPATRSASEMVFDPRSTPAALAANASPVSCRTSSTMSATMSSARSSSSTSTSCCSGRVDPTDITVVPGRSHAPRTVGDSSRERAAQITRLAAPTALSASWAALRGSSRSSRSATNRDRLSGRGLQTLTEDRARAAVMARRCFLASKPEPITATSSSPGLARRSAATAEVAAVRNPVID